MRRRAIGKRLLAATALAAWAMAVPCAPLTAQEETPERLGEVIGHVVDARTGTPLAGAFVSLAGSDWGSFTNQEGRFLLPEMNIGPHTVTIQQLGYKTLQVRVAAAISDAPVRILLDPDPILLEGLEIVSDRFRNRRRAAATPVQTFDLDVLSTSPDWSLRDFLKVRAMTALLPCEGRYSDTCVMDRGQRAESLVYFDEVPLLDGWSYLDTFAPHDLYMVEVYGGGRHIRAYSRFFMERAAKTRLFPLPLPR